MVFKSKIKEELFHSLRQFIFWYHYNKAKTSVATMVGIVPLTNRTSIRYKHTNNHYISLDLVDATRSLLFKLEFDFWSLDGLDYVTIAYNDKGGLGSTGAFNLDDSDNIVDFILQLIKDIPSESYLKHYLNVFKTNFPNWLT